MTFPYSYTMGAPNTERYLMVVEIWHKSSTYCFMRFYALCVHCMFFLRLGCLFTKRTHPHASRFSAGVRAGLTVSLAIASMGFSLPELPDPPRVGGRGYRGDERSPIP